MSEKAEQQAPDRKPVFALDIGTRSVIGLVGYGEDDRFYVQHVEREEYNTRAVVDGQIENIGETAKVVDVVKKRLEQKVGEPLKKVYIAAAGRVLRTMQASFTLELDENEPIHSRTVSDLELGAVQSAYEQVFSSEPEGQGAAFYCVGHAVQKYTLDGYDISSLIDHKGHTAQAHIIATFLPRSVVESLYSTMGRCGLTVAGLTLEPIAAMNAIIPGDLRKLNLALVDIGAGTSDIALCEAGSVTAYTMATIAGDEITETVMNACLVDFATAEKMKQQLTGASDDMIHYVDILGQNHDMRRGEIAEAIAPTVELLAKTIAERIVEAGGHAPAAVFLAGGGSQVIGLAPLVAKELGMDASRVAVGGALNMKRSIVSETDVYGPEFATPTGIALTAIRQQESDTFAVTVNGEQLHLLRSWDTSVLGILQMAGFNYAQIMPRAGRSLHCTVDGERRIVRGELPGQSEVQLNGQPASLIEIVRPGDEISFKPAAAGKDAQATVAQLLGGVQSFEVTFDGETYPAGDVVTINGLSANGETLVSQGDAVVVHKAETVGAFCALLDLDLYVVRVSCNGFEALPSQRLHANDHLQLMAASPSAQEIAVTEPHSAEAVSPRASATFPMQGTAAWTQASSQPDTAQATSTAAQAMPQPTLPQTLHITLNHQKIELPPKEDGAPYQFFDMLAFTDIDPEKPQGMIVQKRNGADASYLEILQENDTIEIYWEKSGSNGAYSQGR